MIIFYFEIKKQNTQNFYYNLYITIMVVLASVRRIGFNRYEADKRKQYAKATTALRSDIDIDEINRLSSYFKSIVRKWRDSGEYHIMVDSDWQKAIQLSKLVYDVMPMRMPSVLADVGSVLAAHICSIASLIEEKCAIFLGIPENVSLIKKMLTVYTQSPEAATLLYRLSSRFKTHHAKTLAHFTRVACMRNSLEASVARSLLKKFVVPYLDNDQLAPISHDIFTRTPYVELKNGSRIVNIGHLVCDMILGSDWDTHLKDCLTRRMDLGDMALVMTSRYIKKVSNAEFDRLLNDHISPTTVTEFIRSVVNHIHFDIFYNNGLQNMCIRLSELYQTPVDGELEEVTGNLFFSRIVDSLHIMRNQDISRVCYNIDLSIERDTVSEVFDNITITWDAISRRVIAVSKNFRSSMEDPSANDLPASRGNFNAANLTCDRSLTVAHAASEILRPAAAMKAEVPFIFGMLVVAGLVWKKGLGIALAFALILFVGFFALKWFVNKFADKEKISKTLINFEVIRPLFGPARPTQEMTYFFIGLI